MLLSHALDILIVVVTIFGVRPIGRLILTRAFRRTDQVPGEFFLSTGLGIFALEILVLLDGLLGWLSKPAAVIVLGLCAVSSGREIARWWRHRTLNRKQSTSPKNRWQLGWQGTVLAAALAACAFNYLPGALLPPVAYDALEYHLGAPHLYVQAGRIFRIDGNVYSNFPFNTEMLYTYSLLLRPAGVVAKLFHFCFALLTVGATISLGRAVGRPLAGLAAALLFLSAPQVAALAISANIDLAVGYYLICSILALRCWLDSRSGSSLALTAAFAGIAMGCKYIAVLLVALPLAVVVGYCTFFRTDQTQSSARTKVRRVLASHGRSAVANLAWFTLVSGGFLSPWLMKNVAYHGNPVFPLMYQFFGGESWSSEEFAIFQSAHSPTLVENLGRVADEFRPARGLQGLGHGVTRLWRVLTGSSVVITLLFLPLPRRRLREAPILYACSFVAFLGYLGWLLFTHQVGRFLTPLFPLIGLPIGYLLFSGRKKLPLAELAILGLLILTLHSAISLAVSLQVLKGYDCVLGRISRDEYYERGFPHFFIIRQINRLPPEENPRILMVGEARPFRIRYPVEMGTVFNRSPLIRRFEEAGSVESLREALVAEGFTHVFHNEIEVARLTRFYVRHGWQEGPMLNRIITKMVRSGYLRLVAASQPDGEGFRAILYEIQ
jgi:hypothetical protein